MLLLFLALLLLLLAQPVHPFVQAMLSSARTLAPIERGTFPFIHTLLHQYLS
jgi:hypothetical protein